MASDSSKQLVQKLYVGYYGRPGDPSGLNFWADVVDVAGGVITESVVNAFGTSTEFTSSFGTLSNDQLIDNLFQQMFGRAADATGKAFWLDRLNGTNDSGLNPGLTQSTLSSIALDIINGAQGTDVSVLDNRVTAAQHFTDQVEAQGVSFTEANIPDVQTLLAQVTDDPVTVVTAEQQMDSFISTTLGGTTGSGQAFTLTDSGSGSGAGDNITGTSGDDTITGGPTTLDSDDVINGGAGTDTLRADLAVDAGNVAPTIKNVEGLTFANAGFAGAGLIFSNIEVSAATSVIFEIAGGDLSATQLPEGMNATLQNWAEGTTATFAPANPGSTNTINLTLNDIKSAHLYFPNYETVTLNSQGSPSSNHIVLGAGVITGHTGMAVTALQPSATLAIQGSSNITIEAIAEKTAGAATAGGFLVGNSGIIQGSAHEGVFTLQLGSDSGVTYNLNNVEGADKIDLGAIGSGNTAIGINGLTAGQDVYIGMTASTNSAASGGIGSAATTTAMFDLNVRSAGSTANTADALDVFLGLCAAANTTGFGYFASMSGMTGVEVLNFNVTTASNSAALLMQLSGNQASGIDVNSINFVSVDPGLASATLSGAVLNGGTALQSLSFTGATATDFRVNQIDNGDATAGITVLGGGGDDFFAADSADLNSIFTLNGGAGNDTLIGAGVNNGTIGTVSGLTAMAGGLDSGIGGDSIVGGAGNDWIVGGLGQDTLEGGDGSDVYHFFLNGDQANNNGNSTAGQMDIINGFATGDIIFLEQTAAATAFTAAATTGAGTTAYTSDANWFGGTFTGIFTASLTSLASTAASGNASALTLAVYVQNGDTFIEFTTGSATGAAGFLTAGANFHRIKLADFTQGLTALGARATDTGIEIFSLV